MTPVGPVDDLRHDTIFFGRSEELIELVRNLQRGRHTLLLGEKGIGKSRLMMEAKWILTGRVRRIEFSPYLLTRRRGKLALRIDPGQYKELFIEHSSPLGECLKELTEKLYYRGDLRIETGEYRSDLGVVKKRLSDMGAVRLQAPEF